MEPADLARRVKDQADRLGAAAKALAAARTAQPPDAAPSVVDLKAWLAGLESARAAAMRLAEDEPALADDLRLALAAGEAALRFDFHRLLGEAFRSAGVEARKVADQPPQYRAGPLTLTVHYATDCAELAYARIALPDGAVPLQPERILAAWRRCTEELRKGATQPENFGPALESAYRALLAREGRALGDRVELVRLHPEIAFALQSKNFLRDPRPGAFRAYGKAAFAFDLNRLRTERALQVGAFRAHFGVATGGAAYDKQAVLWLEDESGAGQYYQSFSLVAAQRAR